MKNILPLFLLCFGLLACQSSATEESETQEPLSDVLPGTWETTYLKVEIDSYNGTDTSFVFEVSEEIWEKKYQVKPYRTYFSADSTFRTVYRGLDNSIMDQTRGLWNTFGDTLMMIQPDETRQLKVVMENGKAHMSGLIDWDKDGSEDDAIYSVHRFAGIGPNE